MRRALLCALVALALLLGGVVVGIATVAVHATAWGLVLALVATGVAAYALPGGWTTRVPFAAGFVGLVGLVLTPRPEGDYLVSATASGYVLLGFTLALLLASIITVRPLRPPSSPPNSPPPTGPRPPDS